MLLFSAYLVMLGECCAGLAGRICRFKDATLSDANAHGPQRSGVLLASAPETNIMMRQSML